MVEKVRLVTTSRQDVVDITHALAHALDLDLMRDAKAPVVIALNGTMESGKAIFADEIYQELFHKPFRTSIVEFRAEEIDGQPVEFDYIDISNTKYGVAVPAALSSNIYAQREEVFLAQRKAGGISIIQNMEHPEHAGISIWVEKNNGHRMHDHQESRVARNGMELTNAFHHATVLYPRRGDEQSWVRYVEIEVHDPRIAASPKFQEMVRFLNETSERVAAEIMTAEPIGFKPRPDDDQHKKRLRVLHDKSKYKM